MGTGEGGSRGRRPIYLWLIHTVVRQKTTQQYKAIIPSIKNKLKNESHPLSRQERVRSQGTTFSFKVQVLAKSKLISVGGSLRARSPDPAQLSLLRKPGALNLAGSQVLRAA